MGENITDGIDICDWTCKYKEDAVTFSIWDFAGQVVYYNTHQFFLSNRAVYLLLWNIRLGHEHAGLEFWLSSIACHAPKAPIIVVGSHKDQVKKFWLPQKELSAKYPQIQGFHAISCYTGDGIRELHQHLLEVTLKEKYMGERIPEAWLKFETSMIQLISQAVQFLHDLGSVQHFQNNVLKTHVVIDPQWIVDAMACVVSVNDSPIENGKFYHKDIGKVWKTFSSDMHHWLLRLTEEFDLTFLSKEDQCNIVPCLLPNTDPEAFCLPDITLVLMHRRTKMLYQFDYLPSGLFNRAQGSLFEEIADGLRHAKVVVACVSEEYVKSRNCQLEFRFASVTLKLPMVLAVVGQSEGWETSEIGMLSLGCPKVNFQYESADALERLLANVQKLLPDEEPVDDSEMSRVSTPSQEENNQLAFQELLELAQRKLLRQLSSYADGSETAVYPHLFLLDFLRDEEKNVLIDEQVKVEREKRKKEEEEEARGCPDDNTGDQERQAPGSGRKSAEPIKIVRPPSAQKQRPSLKHKSSSKLQAVSNVIGAAKFIQGQGVSKDIECPEYCIRFMCEHGDGWHETGKYLVLQPRSGLEWDDFLSSIAPYMARILAVLKHSSLDLPILNQQKGIELRKVLEEKCGSESEYDKEYLQFRNVVMEKDEKREMGDLARCHLPSGKNLWLCDAHRKAERITVLSDDIGEVSAEVIDSTNFLNIKQSSTSKQANAVMNIVARKAQAASNKKGIKASAKVVASTNSANILAPKSKACSVM
ncbi:hypothetical protein CAPTEDRAFT_226169 [Capitella teleta]|uniref:non-specific serine/threonine protein kinase n=1 Tax=Capitella teleta TaxID=283909 RepID=R7ULG2_CAPTE|nr:hypothetical protein CAPTEDRAFT_226169 [Capitella teleta]|eukprot:ELU06933.1 hypothetical protein CAPTEDRAFT_226169 [Capitella teleta]